MLGSDSKSRRLRRVSKKRLLQETKLELDQLRGWVLDGTIRRDYDHISLRGAAFLHQFLRAKKYIRGTAQWKKSGPDIPECWSQTIALSHLASAEKKNFEFWIETVAQDDMEPGPQEHLLTTDELFQVFCLLDDAYYQILDYKLFPHYVELCVGSLTRSIKTKRRRRSGTKARFKWVEATEEEKNIFFFDMWGKDQELAELEHYQFSESGPLTTAISSGMIGGLSLGSKRLLKGLNDLELHSLPCVSSLLQTIDQLFEGKGHEQGARNGFLDGLLVHYFGPWYFIQEEPRRIHDRLSGFRSRMKEQTKALD